MEIDQDNGVQIAEHFVDTFLRIGGRAIKINQRKGKRERKRERDFEFFGP